MMPVRTWWRPDQVQVNKVLFPGDKNNELEYPDVIQSLLTSAESQSGCIKQSILFVVYYIPAESLPIKN